MDCDTDLHGNGYCKKYYRPAKTNCIAYQGKCTAWTDCTYNIQLSE